MTLATVIRAVRPRFAAKWLAAELALSRRQARRIMQTGHAPGRIRRALLQVLLREAERRRMQLEGVENEIREIERAEAAAAGGALDAPALAAGAAPLVLRDHGCFSAVLTDRSPKPGG